MKIDLQILYWGLGISAEEQLQMIQEAEELGYGSVWVAEGYGSDAASMLGWIAAQTRGIGIGSAMFQTPARSPAMTAMTAATLDVLSGGRMKLGIGSSGPVVAESWHGVRFGPSIPLLREYVGIVRKVLSGDRLTFDGDIYRVPVEGAPRGALKLSISSIQEKIPIYLGTMGPKGCSLAAEIADGWMPMFLSPEHFAEQFLPRLEEGALASGRSLDQLDINPMIFFSIDADQDQARDRLRPLLALYIGGMGSKNENFYRRLVTRYGFGDVAYEVQEHFLSGKRHEAESALSAELIDAISLCGTPESVKDKLRIYEQVGIEHLTVTPALDGSAEDRSLQLKELARLAKLAPRSGTS